jgi:tetratricopeptide (TPR) repeat protein
MLRGLFLIVATLSTAGSALAAGDIDTCRDNGADPAARQAACESVIADDKVTGKSKAYAFWFRGDALNKKRDYDGAIAAYSAAHDGDPDNVNYLNSRGIAYSNKGDDEHALADYEMCLQLRPSFSSAYNNRGLIFLRKGDLDRAFEEFNSAVKYPSSVVSRPIHLYNRARAQTYRKQYDAALADFAEAQKVSPDNTQIPNYRCITYNDMGKFDEAIADCNTVLAKFPTSIYTLTNRGNAYLGKGDLDAALNDYNQALKINPNYIRAHAYRGELFEKRRDTVAARYDYRSASATLTKFDEIDTAIARRLAKERLAALTAVAPPSSPSGKVSGKTSAPAPPPGPRKVALIVGNGAYKNVQQLDNPPRDAKLIADTLRGLGFATVTLAPDLTRDRFFAALHQFGSEAEKADWAVVYYAGHGMEIGGINYLIPTDAKLATDRDAETQMVALEQVIAAVSGARKLRLVLLDACRNNPFEKTMQRTIALKLVSKGLSNIEPEAGFMVVYAAKHGETALDGDSKNSPFATALARDIKEPKVEVRKLFDIVRDDVWAATRHGQQPFTYGSPPGREDFYFAAEK